LLFLDGQPLLRRLGVSRLRPCNPRRQVHQIEPDLAYEQ
jgi:hypothetical protein